MEGRTEASATERSRAEAAYAEALAGLEPRRHVDVEGLCRARPEIAAHIRAVHDDWKRVVGVYAALLGGSSMADVLRQRFGQNLDPGVSLDVSPSEAQPSSPSRMVRQLRAHAPRLARYQILGEVGRGGMGAVYSIWDPDLRRRLAMKVVLGRPQKDGTTSIPELQLARFLEEAQITGQLDHPGIVPVHELGLDSERRVYFTMRLVKGRDMEELCKLVREGREGWTLTRAIGVVQRVCEAMAYAHDKGVVHRDLKPANVMVGRFGEVYVMDWGLARVLGREDSHDMRLRDGDTTMLNLVRTERFESRDAGLEPELVTMDGDVIGTPAYMAPEQARGELSLVDARSDVYSVGAILYHLLAGHVPFVPPGEKLDNYAVWRKVRKGPPEPLAERAPDAPPELVAIAEKAMARDPRERYRSMQELSEDLHSYVENKVVRAYERGALAEFRKWVRRNRATALACAAAILLLLGGLASTAWVQAKANERLFVANTDLARVSEEVRRERDAGRRVNDFLVGLFESPDPSLSLGEKITAKAVLDRGARSIDSQLEADPLAAAQFRLSMGNAYRALGLYAEAEPLLERALADRREMRGDADPETLTAMHDLATLYRATGRWDEADQLFGQALAGRRRVLGVADPLTLETQSQIVVLRIQQARYAEAEELGQQVLEHQVAVLGATDRQTLRSENDLASLYVRQARYEEALRYAEEAVAGARDELGEDHPDTLEYLNALAGVQMLLGNLDRAGELYGEALERKRRVLGADHPGTLVTLNDFAYLQTLQGRYQSAQSTYRQVIEGYRSLLGDDHPNTLTAMANLANVERRLGDFDEAERLLLETLDRSERELGEGHANTISCLGMLAALYFERGRYEESVMLNGTALERHSDLMGRDHPVSLSIMYGLASGLARLGRHDEALELAREAVRLTPPDDPELPGRGELVQELERADH